MHHGKLNINVNPLFWNEEEVEFVKYVDLSSEKYIFRELISYALIVPVIKALVLIDRNVVIFFATFIIRTNQSERQCKPFCKMDALRNVLCT